MISLAVGSGLMIAVTVRYVQSRQKFTQWSPPKFNSATSGSEAGTNYSGTHNSSRPINNTGRNGMYDRWLMVRFTIAFILLASVHRHRFSRLSRGINILCSVFEVTNTLFQITALQNNVGTYSATARTLFESWAASLCGDYLAAHNSSAQATEHSIIMSTC